MNILAALKHEEAKFEKQVSVTDRLWDAGDLVSLLEFEERAERAA